MATKMIPYSCVLNRTEFIFGIKISCDNMHQLYTSMLQQLSCHLMYVKAWFKLVFHNFRGFANILRNQADNREKSVSA